MMQESTGASVKEDATTSAIEFRELQSLELALIGGGVGEVIFG